MQVSINFPAYHGTFNAGTALARLKTVDRPGAYLIRFNKDFIISYIAESGDIKHEIINNAKGTSLRDENPGLITISQTVDFLLKCDQTEKFVYLVSWRDFEEAAAFTNYRHDRHICHVCDRVFRDPAELYNHLQIHKFSFCKHCNKHDTPLYVYNGHNTVDCKFPEGKPGTNKSKREHKKYNHQN